MTRSTLYQSMLRGHYSNSMLEGAILLAMLILTLKYRHDLAETQLASHNHRANLLQLTHNISSLQTHLQQLQDYYHDNYQVVLAIVQDELKQLRSKLKRVADIYDLNS